MDKPIGYEPIIESSNLSKCTFAELMELVYIAVLETVSLGFESLTRYYLYWYIFYLYIC